MTFIIPGSAKMNALITTWRN